MVEQGRSLERVTNRWAFAGVIDASAPLHIGSGEALGLASESAVVRDAAGRPYLPASTIKGALRACVDRLAPVIGAGRGVTSCGLSPREEQCPSPPGSPAHAAFEAALREFRGSAPEREEQLVRLLGERLCSVCRLFGSPWLAGRVFVGDARPLADELPPAEIRDGVSIDRDTGVARDLSRYSYEALPAALRFGFHLEAENLDAADAALLALALAEWQHGRVYLGAGRGRGLAASRLALDAVQTLDFAAAERAALLDHLRSGALPERDPAAWLDEALSWYFAGGNEGPGA